MPQIHVNAYIHASPDDVFALVSDHVRFLEATGASRVTITRLGHDEPNGHGCLREVRGKGIRLLEEITAFERPARIDYQIVESTLPIQHRGGSMRFIARGDGTEVDWRSDFELGVPLIGGPAAEFARGLLADAFTQLLMAAKAELER
jgi:Polyketide cyclase / dehydrase and lipid transport